MISSYFGPHFAILPCILALLLLKSAPHGAPVGVPRMLSVARRRSGAYFQRERPAQTTGEVQARTLFNRVPFVAVARSTVSGKKSARSDPVCRQVHSRRVLQRFSPHCWVPRRVLPAIASAWWSAILRPHRQKRRLGTQPSRPKNDLNPFGPPNKQCRTNSSGSDGQALRVLSPKLMLVWKPRFRRFSFEQSG